MNEIVTKIGETSSTCTNYVKTLIELGIVKKETPITEKAGKKTVYLLSDNFFRFWYRFVPANIGAIDSGRIDRIYQKAIKDNLSDYMGITFEKMCQDYLIYYAKDLPIIINEIGQWWGTDSKSKKQVQIDIVASSVETKEYIIGSCKFKNEKIGMDELELLKSYSNVFGKGDKYYYYIFSKGGFTEGLVNEAQKGNVVLIKLDDMYEN